MLQHSINIKQHLMTGGILDYYKVNSESFYTTFTQTNNQHRVIGAFLCKVGIAGFAGFYFKTLKNHYKCLRFICWLYYNMLKF